MIIVGLVIALAFSFYKINTLQFTLEEHAEKLAAFNSASQRQNLEKPAHQPKIDKFTEICNRHKPESEDSYFDPPSISERKKSKLPATFIMYSHENYKDSEDAWVSDDVFYVNEDAYYFSVRFVYVDNSYLMYVCFYMLTNAKDISFPQEADIVLQLVNQHVYTHRHHVLRLRNLQFRRNANDRIETGYSCFLNFSKYDIHFIYQDYLKFSVINIEFDKNTKPPITFAMCQYNDYKRQDWSTFPFYNKPNGIEFVIRIRACFDGPKGNFSIYARKRNERPFNGNINLKFMAIKGDYDDNYTSLSFKYANEGNFEVEANPFTCAELEKNYINNYDCLFFKVVEII